MKRIVCFGAVVIALIAILAAIPLSKFSARAAGSFASVPAGHAYAALITPTISTIVGTGIVEAPAGISCTQASTTSTGHVNSLAIATLVNTGTADTSVTNTQTATSGLIQSHATVQNVNLVGGLLKATSIKIGVQTTADASGAKSTVTEATFSNLVINGTSQPTNPAPNTVRNLAGLGSVTLNEQSLTNATKSSNASVNAVDIRITVANNTLGLPVNTQIIIGHADSNEVIESQPTTVRAGAYGLYEFNSSNVVLSPLAYATTSCAGGFSQKSAAATTLPVIGSLGAASSTASANITSTGGTASAQSKVSGLNLLGSLIKADAIIARANATLGTTGSGSGSVTLNNATILGMVQPQNPAPNTRVTLPGLGYVTLNEQSHTFNSTTAFQGVYAMDINVTTALNVFGLPVGTRIIVAGATANVSYA